MVCRVRIWSDYNAGLIARGRLTTWIHQSAIMSGSEAKSVTRGRPQVYSDALIQALLTLEHVYHLTLRAAQEFVQSRRRCRAANRFIWLSTSTGVKLYGASSLVPAGQRR